MPEAIATANSGTVIENAGLSASKRVERHDHVVTVGEGEEKQDGDGKGEDDDSQEANHASLIRPTAEPEPLIAARLCERS